MGGLDSLLFQGLEINLVMARKESLGTNRPALVVAGGIPPPIGGQALMVEDFLVQLKTSGQFRVFHWAFQFAGTAQTIRRISWKKIWAAFFAIINLLKIRKTSGIIDVLLYPVGGPQTVPILRDLLLLPWALALSQRVILHFHAGGVDEGLGRQSALVRWLAGNLYCRSYASITLTRFGVREPSALGIKKIETIPLDFRDTFDEKAVQRGESSRPQLLCLGHVCEEKGSLLLLQAARFCLEQGIDLQLVLAGDCLQPCSEKVLRGWIHSLGLESVVEWRGCLEGESKKVLFGEAELFLFPSLALESFGIVMVEAMMWGLPVMALDRRANYEVLCAPPEELRVRSPEVFAERLVEVIRERARWMEWGKENREKFLQNHLRRSGKSRLVEFLAQTANEAT